MYSYLRDTTLVKAPHWSKLKRARILHFTTRLISTIRGVRPPRPLTARSCLGVFSVKGDTYQNQTEGTSMTTIQAQGSVQLGNGTKGGCVGNYIGFARIMNGT